MTIPEMEKYICTGLQIEPDQLQQIVQDAQVDIVECYEFLVPLTAIASCNHINIQMLMKLYRNIKANDYKAIANSVYTMLIRAKYKGD